jgi:hypothetical protein
VPHQLTDHVDRRFSYWSQARTELNKGLCLNPLVHQNVIEDANLLVVKAVRLVKKEICYSPEGFRSFLRGTDFDR